MISKELVEKIRVGDPITDDELDQAIEFYETMTTGADVLGSTFYLFWWECRRTLDRLYGYREARQERKKGA